MVPAKGKQSAEGKHWVLQSFVTPQQQLEMNLPHLRWDPVTPPILSFYSYAAAVLQKGAEHQKSKEGMGAAPLEKSGEGNAAAGFQNGGVGNAAAGLQKAAEGNAASAVLEEVVARNAASAVLEKAGEGYASPASPVVSPLPQSPSPAAVTVTMTVAEAGTRAAAEADADQDVKELEELAAAERSRVALETPECVMPVSSEVGGALSPAVGAILQTVVAEAGSEAEAERDP
jgi:hypothetical protein